MIKSELTALTAGLRNARPLNWEDIQARTQYIRTCQSVASHLEVHAHLRNKSFDKKQFLRDCGAA